MHSSDGASDAGLVEIHYEDLAFLAYRMAGGRGRGVGRRAAHSDLAGRRCHGIPAAGCALAASVRAPAGRIPGPRAGQSCGRRMCAGNGPDRPGLHLGRRPRSRTGRPFK